MPYSKKKPVIPLLCKDPNALIREKTETDEATWQKLSVFRNKVEEKHTCVYWSSVDELKSKVILGLTSAVKRHPATGWVRADKVPSGDHLKEILELQNKLAQLEAEKELSGQHPPEGTSDLSQGDDLYTFNIVIKLAHPNFQAREDWKTGSFKLKISWNDLFKKISPILIRDIPDIEFRESFERLLLQDIERRIEDSDEYLNVVVKKKTCGRVRNEYMHNSTQSARINTRKTSANSSIKRLDLVTDNIWRICYDKFDRYSKNASEICAASSTNRPLLIAPIQRSISRSKEKTSDKYTAGVAFPFSLFPEDLRGLPK